jgi:predicted Zn-dependent protease
MTARLASCLLIAAACLAVSGCKTPSSTTAITHDQEKTIGDWAAAQIQSEASGPTDPAIVAEVDGITKKLDGAVTCEAPRILISDSDSYTVTSLPGDWVVISANTVTLFHDNPDALAGLLAHEFAHVENDDAGKQMINALGADAMVNITTQGKYTDASNVAVQLMNFGHSIQDEYKADAEGVRIADAAGYDPNGIVVAIAKLKSVTPSTDAQWLVVHPVTPKRLKLLMRDVAAYSVARKTKSNDH